MGLFDRLVSDLWERLLPGLSRGEQVALIVVTLGALLFALPSGVTPRPQLRESPLAATQPEVDVRSNLSGVSTVSRIVRILLTKARIDGRVGLGQGRGGWSGRAD